MDLIMASRPCNNSFGKCFVIGLQKRHANREISLQTWEGSAI